MNNQNIDKETRLRIINTISQRALFFTTYKSRAQRLLHAPFKTFHYYSLSVFAHIHPFKVKFKTLWNDTLTFYMPEGNAIYYYGFFEANLTNLFLRLIKEGDVFIDVGAHVGYYSNLCSHLVGQSGAVHSFEPTPRTFSSLQKNTEQFKNIKVNNFGVLDKETTIHFTDYGPKFSAFNSFKSRTNANLLFLEKEKVEIEIPTKVLDTYFQENLIKPTFVKIDAEGADYLVLSGMKNTLQKDRPIISIEMAGGKEWDENHKSCMHLLNENNYTGYEISTEGLLKKHTEEGTYEYDNLLFIPNEKVDGILSSLINIAE